MIKAIAIDDEPLALEVIEALCSEVDFIDLQKKFTQPTEALKHLRKFPADLVFLDIKMPSISGISLAKEIKQNTMVIFTTAFSEYAVESYELNAIDYLMKPIGKSRFLMAVQKAKELFELQSKKTEINSRHIYIRADFSLVQIPVADILLMEGMADYVKIHILNRKTVVARMTMKELQSKLPDAEFVRVNRSVIVPVNRIESVRNKTVYLSDMEIPIGNTYLEEFSKRFTKT
jgi:DNA-binding LytR/AlgR family response regulator